MTKFQKGIRMSMLGFLLKPKKEMAKKDTSRVRMGKYTVSSHAQNRIVDPKRDLKKTDLVRNLFGRSIQSKPYKHKDGTKQYDRVNRHNRTLTNITCHEKVVKSIRKYHKRDESKALKNFGGNHGNDKS